MDINDDRKNDAATEMDSLTVNGDRIIVNRRTEDTQMRVEVGVDGITVNVCRLDSVQPPHLASYSQPASQTASVGNSVNKEKAQSGNGGKNRIRRLMDKIPFGAQLAANLALIAKNAKDLIGSGMFSI